MVIIEDVLKPHKRLTPRVVVIIERIKKLALIALIKFLKIDGVKGAGFYSQTKLRVLSKVPNAELELKAETKRQRKKALKESSVTKS